VRVAGEGRLVVEKGEAIAVAVTGDGDGCLQVPASGAGVQLGGLSKAGRGKVVLSTCEPRAERTPEAVETNVLEIR
jgi:hypothetical protein